MNQTADLSGPLAHEIIDRMRELRRTDDPSAFIELKRLGDAFPAELIEVTRADLADLVTEAHAAASCGSGDMELGIAAKLRELRAELLAGSTSAVVRLAVETACYRWLDHWTAETGAAKRPGGVTPAQEARRSWAQKRFLQSLAYVARLHRITSPRAPRTAIAIVTSSPSSPSQGRRPLVIDVAPRS